MHKNINSDYSLADQSLKIDIPFVGPCEMMFGPIKGWKLCNAKKHNNSSQSED